MKLLLSRSISWSSRLYNNVNTSNNAEAIKHYFETTNFQFSPSYASRNIAELKKAINVIYLRKLPLVCFDVEAYERLPSKITEVGFAIYDPKLLRNSIVPFIQSGHFIIKEHKHLINHKFVPNNKTTFIGGVSYVVPLTQCVRIMNDILKEYIENRGGAFVGHHISSDIKWLKDANIEINPNTPVVDTHNLYSYSRSRGGTLRGILRMLNIPHALLHNAGNDAYYTILAAMAICDPETRQRHQLDKFIEVEAVDKRTQSDLKFSDRAQVISGLETEDIIKRLTDPSYVFKA